jgi:hypothetical protein
MDLPRLVFERSKLKRQAMDDYPSGKEKEFRALAIA